MELFQLHNCFNIDLVYQRMLFMYNIYSRTFHEVTFICGSEVGSCNEVCRVLSSEVVFNMSTVVINSLDIQTPAVTLLSMEKLQFVLLTYDFARPQICGPDRRKVHRLQWGLSSLHGHEEPDALHPPRCSFCHDGGQFHHHKSRIARTGPHTCYFLYAPVCVILRHVTS